MDEVLEWFKNKLVEIERFEFKPIEMNNLKELERNKPISTGEYLTIILSKNNIKTEDIKKHNTFSGWNPSLEDYLTNRKDLDNPKLLVLCNIIDMSVKEIMDVNDAWLDYKRQKKELKKSVDDELKNRLESYKKEYEKLIKNQVIRYERELGILKYKQKEIDDLKESISELDTDKTLSELITDINILDKAQIIDKVLIAKNGLIRLQQEKENMISREDYTKEQEQIEKTIYLESKENKTKYYIILIQTITIFVLALFLFLK